MRKARKTLVAIVLSTCLINSVNAQKVNIKNFFYRDFLDMGQNKGVFAPYQSNIPIQSSKNPEISVSFPSGMPFLDSSPRSNNGNVTALGRGFGVTALHVTEPENSSFTNANYYSIWGQTFYDKPKSASTAQDPYGTDTKFYRYGKFIVEGQANLLQTDIKGTTRSVTSESQEAKENIAALKKAYENLQRDENNKIIVFQAGSGNLTLFGGSSSQDIGNISVKEGMRGGSFGELQDDPFYYKFKQSSGGYGLGLMYIPNYNMLNAVTQGDSGSGLFGYDKVNKKHVLLGVASQNFSQIGSNKARFSFVSQSDFDDYRKKFEQEIDLKNKQDWVYQNGGIDNAQGGGYHLFQVNKDTIFKGGGKIEIHQNIYKNSSGVGGFVFKAQDNANASNMTKYTITSKKGNTNFGFDGSGLDIEENVIVEWGLGFISDKIGVNDALHKIGKGTLTITDFTNANGTNDKYGYLRVGEGKVIFDTTQQHFNAIYITSGRSTIELVQGKAEAFGATKITNGQGTTNNNYELKQDKNTEMGFYFGNGGGILDLKGNSLKLNTISSNDARANIINTNNTNHSTITIEGYGYNKNSDNENGKKTSNKADTIIHASFGQKKTDSTQTNNNNNNNIKIKYEGNNAGSTNSNANLVFDGNMDIKELDVSKNGNVTLQGHPTTHAYIRDKNVLEKVKLAEGMQNIPSWMDLTRPSTLEQPDWDYRTFKIEEVKLDNSSLNIGREAALSGKITATNNAKINFGGDIEHFIDKRDGENTMGNGFTYYQDIEKNQLKMETQEIANQTIHFNGEIDIDSGSINSKIYNLNLTNLNMKNNAILNADYLTLEKKNGAKTPIANIQNDSNATIKNLILKNIQDNDKNNIVSISGSNSKFQVKDSLGFENSNISNLDTFINGGGNNIKPTEDEYDLFLMGKSIVTGTNTTIKGNVGVINESKLTLQTIALENKTNTATNPKNTIIVDGGGAMLTANNKITSNQNNTTILISGEKPLDTTQGSQSTQPKEATLKTEQGIELTGNGTTVDKNGSVIAVTNNGRLDSNLKITNLNLNMYIDKTSSFNQGKNLESNKSNISIIMEQGNTSDFNIDAKDNSSITLKGIQMERNIDITKSFYKGTIAGDNNSSIITKDGSINAKIDLKNGSKLDIQNGILVLDNNHNSISLKNDNTALKVNTILVNNMSNGNSSLNITKDSNSTFDVENFIFKSGNLSTQKLYGRNVSLQEKAIVMLNNSNQSSSINNDVEKIELKDGSSLSVNGAGQNGTLNLSGNNTNIHIDRDSKLDIGKLDANNQSNINIFFNSDNNINPMIESNFAINAQNQSNVFVNQWHYKNTNNSITTDDSSSISFDTLKATRANSPLEVDANVIVKNYLQLDNTATIRQKRATSPIPTQMNDKFYTLKLTDGKNLTLEDGSIISVLVKQDITTDKDILDKYYTLITGNINDKRNDKRMYFDFGGDKSLYWTTITTDDKIQVKFSKEDPSSYNELRKYILNEELLAILIQHDPNDKYVKMAGTANQYEILERHLNNLDTQFSRIAKSNSGVISNKILYNSNDIINNHLIEIQTKQPVDNFWSNVGGGYFGQDSGDLMIYGTNFGYDKTMSFAGNPYIFGAMVGFGGANYNIFNIKENTLFYNFALYAHTRLNQKHEIQSNINLTYLDGNRTIKKENDILGDNIKSRTFGMLWSNYYKYRFELAMLGAYQQILKPVGVISMRTNSIGAMNGSTYKQKAYNDFITSLGAGVEYSFLKQASTYGVQVLAIQDIYNSNGVNLSLKNAQNFKTYKLNNNITNMQINLFGYNDINDYLSIKYGVSTLVDIAGNFGMKGNAIIEYKFQKPSKNKNNNEKIKPVNHNSNIKNNNIDFIIDDRIKMYKKMNKGKIDDILYKENIFTIVFNNDFVGKIQDLIDEFELKPDEKYKNTYYLMEQDNYDKIDSLMKQIQKRD